MSDTPATLTADYTPLQNIEELDRYFERLYVKSDSGENIGWVDPKRDYVVRLFALARLGLAAQQGADPLRAVVTDIRNQAFKCLAIDADFDAGWVLARCNAAIAAAERATDSEGK